MKKKIARIHGDGIGPEVVNAATKVLDEALKKNRIEVEYRDVLLGGASIDATGEPVTEETIRICKESDAVLMGSIGGDPKVSPWYQLEPGKRPEAGLLRLRKELGVFANLRPGLLYPELEDACPLRKEIAVRGFDVMMVRELTGGAYFGKRKTEVLDGERVATDEMLYSESEIRRCVRKAFEIAEKRDKRVTLVDKSNVLDTSRLWHAVGEEVAREYPGICYDTMLVDNCSMQLIRDPSQFDVIVTENLFGDILSDEMSMIAGSIGMLPSASLNEGKFGLYEPIGGSAPDLAGKNVVNPIATILSAAMMLKYSFDLDTETNRIEAAVKKTLQEGIRTADIAAADSTIVGTQEMTDAILKNMREMES